MFCSVIIFITPVIHILEIFYLRNTVSVWNRDHQATNFRALGRRSTDEENGKSESVRERKKSSRWKNNCPGIPKAGVRGVCCGDVGTPPVFHMPLAGMQMCSSRAITHADVVKAVSSCPLQSYFKVLQKENTPSLTLWLENNQQHPIAVSHLSYRLQFSSCSICFMLVFFFLCFMLVYNGTALTIVLYLIRFFLSIFSYV